jgi:hypothetical protein
MKFSTLLIVFVAGKLPDAKIDFREYPVVVAIPDTHGDVEAAISSVWIAYSKLTPKAERMKIVPFKRVIKMAIEWAGKETRILTSLPPGMPRISPSLKSGIALVQLGDLVDRGPDSRECIDLFEVLPLLLPGWKILKLYGNHDIWTLLENPGIQHVDKITGKTVGYINPEDLDKFVPPGTVLDEVANENYRIPQFRATGVYYERYLASYLGMAKWEGPPGLNTLFVHAGIDKAWFENVAKPAGSGKYFGTSTKTWDVDDFNAELKAFLLHSSLSDATKEKLLFYNSDDPEKEGNSFIWTRLVSMGHESLVCNKLEEALSLFKVDRIVVGHTPPSKRQARKAVSKCNGKFIKADMAMSGWMWDNTLFEAFALILDSRSDNKVSVTAHYAGDNNEVLSETLLPPEPKKQKPVEPPKTKEHDQPPPNKQPAPKKNDQPHIQTEAPREEPVALYRSMGLIRTFGVAFSLLFG